MPCGRGRVQPAGGDLGVRRAAPGGGVDAVVGHATSRSSRSTRRWITVMSRVMTKKITADARSTDVVLGEGGRHGLVHDGRGMFWGLLGEDVDLVEQPEREDRGHQGDEDQRVP